MPGFILNPIANMGTQKEVVPPYIPEYNDIYAASYNLYKVSGSQVGNVTSGGIVKLSFEGNPNFSFMSQANANLNPSEQLKEVRFAGGARDRIVADTRITSGSTTYRQIRLIDKTTGTVTGSHPIHSDAGGGIYGFDTDTQEQYVYAYGQSNMKFDDESDTFIGGLIRMPYNTIDVDLAFTSSIGDGPTNTIGGQQPFIHDVHVNPNGKIGVCHNGTDWDNNSNKYANFVVLNEDGTVDTTFDFGAKKFTDQYDTQIQTGAIRSCLWFESGSQGYWMVGGNFQRFDSGSEYQRVMIFDETGSAVQSFSDFLYSTLNNRHLNSNVRDIEYQDKGIPGGRIGVYGDFAIPGFNQGVSLNYQGGALLGFTKQNNSIHKATTEYINAFGTKTIYMAHIDDEWEFNDSTVSPADGIGAFVQGTYNSGSFGKVGAGLQTSANGVAEPGSLFLG